MLKICPIAKDNVSLLSGERKIPKTLTRIVGIDTKSLNISENNCWSLVAAINSNKFNSNELFSKIGQNLPAKTTNVSVDVDFFSSVIFMCSITCAC